MNTTLAPDAGDSPQTPPIDWYERRDELWPGMIFRTADGIVKLDRTVPGDGTKWYVADFWDGWAHMDSTIEPGDLIGEPLAEDDPALRRTPRA